MKMHANVKCVYDQESFALAVASALRPDNFQAPSGIQITTARRGKQVVTNIAMDGKIETFLATLDDLLSCTSTAESML
ncbi:MAG: hypothetical protein COT21_03700 [Hadesarchaea archaeon CG08_land_8_20_14_0_20_51_8]|nr:MAG: hypothetical protein COT21_03700 [Hadesarchaea archaeon CG08_land_8_20_14_0_20_51_8]